MKTIILLAALAIIPRLPVVDDRCAAVELNHFFDENGRLVFDQLIYYDWHDEPCRFHVVAWRLLKTPDQLPVRDRRRGGYSAVWLDGEVLRVVRATSRRESWTQFDPELIERERLSRELGKERLAK